MGVSFVLNGKSVAIGNVDPHETLLGWLRANGFTGSKEGCAEGECGACAVALVRRGSYQPVNGCLVLLASMDGQEIVTVEGVASGGELHAVQQAMLAGGSQCGYCTPGFVVSLFCEFHRPGREGYDPESIAGNLCRCTGYRPIIDAARSLGRPREDDPFQARLSRDAPALTRVDHSCNGHRFFRPTSLDEALTFLAEHPDAIIVGGGTDLVVYANQRFESSETLMSIEALPELLSFAVDDEGATFGAAVPLAEIEARLHREHAGELRLLEQLFPLFSSRLIRNRATLGGNLATASPIGDAPPALLALDAEVRIASRAGERSVPLCEFFTGYRKSALRPGELLRSVRIPRPFPLVQCFYKVSKRVADDISTVAAGFAVDRDLRGAVTRARLAYGGIAATPLRALAAERALEGRLFDAEAIASARSALERTGTPMDDLRGSAAYRREMIVRLFDKFVLEVPA